jgi:cation:H+ antiporter
MTREALMLLAGLLLIIKGGDWFVAGSIRFAEFLRMPRVVIGSTLVSLTTTMPEMLVSIMAGMRGEAGLAIGNAVGSCICNIGLILGVTAVIRHMDFHFSAIKVPLLSMVGLGVLLLLMTLDLHLERWQGALLLVLGAAYFVWDFTTAWKDRKPADLAEAGVIKKDIIAGRRFLETQFGAGVQFFGGAAVVLLGSNLLVDGAVGIAHRLGIPPIVIGLTVVALGTSLPELVTAVTSSRKSVSDLALGNVLGANIANLSLVVGVAALLQEVSMDRVTQLFNFPAMMAMMGLVVFFAWTGRRVTHREGGILIGCYVAYIAGVVLITISGRQ